MNDGSYRIYRNGQWKPLTTIVTTTHLLTTWKTTHTIVTKMVTITMYWTMVIITTTKMVSGYW